MYRILVVLVVAVALAIAYRRYRQQRTSLGVMLGWVVFWLTVLIFGLLPTWSQAITSVVGIGRGADLFFFFSILLLLLVNFILLGKLQSVRYELTTLVRALALRDAGLDSTTTDSPPPPSPPQDND